VKPDDVLMLVAFKNGYASTQLLVPLKKYVKTAKKGRIAVKADLKTDVAISTYLIVKSSVPIPAGINAEKIKAAQELVEKAIDELRLSVETKTTAEIAEIIYASSTYRAELETLLGVVGARNACDFQSWEFISGRPSAEALFGDPLSFLNMDAATPTSGGVYTLSHPLINDDPTVAFTKTVADAGFADTVTMSFEAVGQPGGCYDENGGNFSLACPGSWESDLSAGDWSFDVDTLALVDGATYHATLTAFNKQCDAVVATTDLKIKWDTTPPVPTLAGAPADPSTATALNITVTDSDDYRYALIAGPTGDCSAATYSGWTAATTPITAATGADGAKTLCVEARDAARNVAAVTHEWGQDTTPPTSFTLTGVPTGTSPVLTLAVTVGGADTVFYKYKVGASATTDCAVATGYSSQRAVALPINASIAGLADGSITLCAIGRDAVGNWHAFADATQAMWTKASIPSLTVLSHPNVTGWSGTGTLADRYVFAVAEDSTNGEVNFTATDPQGDAMTLTCSSAPAYITVDNTNKKLTMAPLQSHVGAAVNFSCKVNDGTSDSPVV
jgi:hypothetical protein